MKLPVSIVCAVIGTLWLLGCSHALAPEGHFQTSPIHVDGEISDWGLPLRFSNAAYTMQYGVTNDDKYVYVCVYTKDPNLQMRILRSGMNLYFDTKGEKNKNMNLVFPVKKSNYQDDRENGQPMRTSDNSELKNQLLLQSDYYNATGFTNFENGQYGISDTKSKILVSLKLHPDSSLVYEAAVPISYIMGTDMKPSYSNENFSVGISINASSYASRNASNSSYPRSYYGGGMHGMHGGGMGGGNRYNSSQNPPKPEENWYQFRLVYKKN